MQTHARSHTVKHRCSGSCALVQPLAVEVGGSGWRHSSTNRLCGHELSSTWPISAEDHEVWRWASARHSAPPHRVYSPLPLLCRLGFSPSPAPLQARGGGGLRPDPHDIWCRSERKGEAEAKLAAARHRPAVGTCEKSPPLRILQALRLGCSVVRAHVGARGVSQKSIAPPRQAGIHPLYVDSPNMRLWEMRPFVELADRLGAPRRLARPRWEDGGDAGRLSCMGVFVSLCAAPGPETHCRDRSSHVLVPPRRAAGGRHRLRPRGLSK